MTPRAYYLRRELKPHTCIVEGCACAPTDWSCLCQAHFMRWRINGTFRTKAENNTRIEDLAWMRTHLRREEQHACLVA